MRLAQRFHEWLAIGCCRMSALLTVSMLAAVLLLLIFSGFRVMNLHFLTANWQHMDIAQGGIFPALFGSIALGIGVITVSFPLGLATAVFLTEYRPHALWKRTVQLAIRNLAGVPSVVYGLFGLAVFVQTLAFGMSLLAAILTLSIMTLPWVITAAIEALEAVPLHFRESSLVLGSTHLQTTWHIVLPAALPGSITGGIIGVARALGETAPLILVGATFYLSHLPRSLLDPFMALPYHTFILATQHSSPVAAAYAAGTALVLFGLTVLLCSGAILARFWFRKKKDW